MVICSGDIEMMTKSLSISNGAQLIADVRGEGNAGTITINAKEKVSFEGKGIGLSGGEPTELPSGVFTQVNPQGIGNGNLITINPPLLLLDNDAKISASTFGQGKAGNIEVEANIFEATNGGQILTATSSTFDAGNITLEIEDNILLDGNKSGIFANTVLGSEGNGGSISTNNFIPENIIVPV